jgi:adenylate kinase
MKKIILIFGPPCSGKGTQSKIIASKYNLKHLSTGDILRDEQAKGTKIGNIAKELIDKGQFVPDMMVIEMIKQAIIDNDGYDGFIFDGFPRTSEQAKFIDQFLFIRQTPISHVILLEAPTYVLCERMKERAIAEGRADDTPETIPARLNKYANDTQAAVQYFTNKNNLLKVDATKTKELVTEEIFTFLDESSDSQR